MSRLTRPNLALGKQQLVERETRMSYYANSVYSYSHVA
jgi:hypothetical protein